MRSTQPNRHRVHTITYDNGHEFAGHKEMEAGLDARVFFAHDLNEVKDVVVESISRDLDAYNQDEFGVIRSSTFISEIFSIVGIN